MQRATSWQINEDLSLITCGAEDLVVYKVFAGRPHDWSDIEMIVARQEALNRELVLTEAEPLLELKEASRDLEHLEGLLRPGSTSAG